MRVSGKLDQGMEDFLRPILLGGRSADTKQRQILVRHVDALQPPCRHPHPVRIQEREHHLDKISVHSWVTIEHPVSEEDRVRVLVEDLHEEGRIAGQPAADPGFQGEVGRSPPQYPKGKLLQLGALVTVTLLLVQALADLA